MIVSGVYLLPVISTVGTSCSQPAGLPPLLPPLAGTPGFNPAALNFATITSSTLGSARVLGPRPSSASDDSVLTMSFINGTSIAGVATCGIGCGPVAATSNVAEANASSGKRASLWCKIV